LDRTQNGKNEARLSLPFWIIFHKNDTPEWVVVHTTTTCTEATSSNVGAGDDDNDNDDDDGARNDWQFFDWSFL
jgi:hypothetical protein